MITHDTYTISQLYNMILKRVRYATYRDLVSRGGGKYI